MYDFHAKDLIETSAIKSYADHTVKQIQSHYGWDTDIQLNIQPEAKGKRLYSVSMSVVGLEEPILVKKNGKDVMSLLRKVRKSVLRQIQKLGDRRVGARRRALFKQAIGI